MKKSAAAFFLAVSLCLCVTAPSFAAEIEDSNTRAMERTILRLLSDSAGKAVRDYYGQPRQYWRDELLSVRSVPGTPYCEAVMRVETFYGPHNPPYGVDTLTFLIGYGTVELEGFKHRAG